MAKYRVIALLAAGALVSSASISDPFGQFDETGWSLHSSKQVATTASGEQLHELVFDLPNHSGILGTAGFSVQTSDSSPFNVTRGDNLNHAGHYESLMTERSFASGSVERMQVNEAPADTNDGFPIFIRVNSGVTPVLTSFVAMNNADNSTITGMLADASLQQLGTDGSTDVWAIYLDRFKAKGATDVTVYSGVQTDDNSDFWNHSEVNPAKPYAGGVLTNSNTAVNATTVLTTIEENTAMAENLRGYIYVGSGVVPTLTAANIGNDNTGAAANLVSLAINQDNPTAFVSDRNETWDVWELIVSNDSITGDISVNTTVTTSDGSDFYSRGTYIPTLGNSTGFPSSGSSYTGGAAFSHLVNNAPVFVSVAAVDYAENRNDAALTVVATDGDGDGVTFSSAITGPDAAAFSFDAATGVLSFASQPDFENPADADGDNAYSITVEATDGVNDPVTQDIVITVTDASEADTHTSIDTAAVSQMLGGELTVDGLGAVLEGLAVAADAADEANKAEIMNLINVLQTDVAAAAAAADRLEAYEMGQIEELLTQLVETEGFQALLETASVTVNGESRSVASILQAMAEAPVVANWKRTSDSNGDMNGVIATLADGSAVTFAMTVEAVDAETNKHIFSVEDFAGSGLAKSFYMVMKAKTVAFGGLFGGRLANAQIGWHLTEMSSMLFDVIGNSPSSAGTIDVPDFNNDGAEGNA